MTRTFWLSFVDDTRPKGERFLGVCIVDVNDEDAADVKAFQTHRFPNALTGSEWLGAAVRKAHRIGCNPGGEVNGMDITDATPSGFLVRNQLLSRAELDELDWKKFTLQ